MKRVFSLLMAILLLLSMIPGATAATACPPHDWYTVPGNTGPTCTQGANMIRVCHNCLNQEPFFMPALGHAWGDWSVLDVPTCFSEGLSVRYCERCGISEQKKLRVNHEYGPWQVQTAPTCTEEGHNIRYCTLCGMTQTEPVASLGHYWGEWYVAKEPTQTEPGYEERDCVRCHLAETRELPMLPGGEEGPGGDHERPDASLAAFGPGHAPYPARVGCVVEVPVYITNTGEVSLNGLSSAIYTMGGAESGDLFQCSDKRRYGLEPGDTMTAWMFLTVTEADVAEGAIRRQVQVSMTRADTLETVNAAPFTTYVGLLTEEELPELPHPELALSTVLAGDHFEFYEGEEVNVVWTVTNIGKNGCVLLSLNEVGQPTAYTYIDGFATGTVLLPGQSVSGTAMVTAPAIDDNPYKTLRFVVKGTNVDDPDENVEASDLLGIRMLEGSPTWQPEPDPVEGVSIRKMLNPECEEGRADPEGFSVGEELSYTLVVEVPAGVKFEYAYVHDPLTGLIDIIPNERESDAQYFFQTSYIATEEDAVRGFVANRAFLTYVIDGYPTQICSNSVVEPVVSRWEEPHLPAITKILVSSPTNGEFFMPGETVEYEITIWNCTDGRLTDVIVYDDLLAGTDDYAKRFRDLAPGDTYTWRVWYTVTEEDCMLLEVENTASYSALLDDERVADMSNIVVIPTGFEGDPPTLPMLPNIVVTKAETSEPENHSYYVKGETIRWDIVVANYGEVRVTDLFVYDMVDGIQLDAPLTIGYVLEPGDILTLPYSLTVESEHVANGCVYNVALVDYVDPEGGSWTSVSNLVVSDTDGIPDLPGDPFDAIQLPGEGSSCELVLTALGEAAGEYELHICGYHQPASAEAVDAMARGDYAAARAAWTGAINEMYDVLFAAARTPDARAKVMTEKAMFYAMVNVRESLLRASGLSGEQVGAKISQLLRDACAELCCTLHTAPDARPEFYQGHAVTLNDAPAAVCTVTVHEENAAMSRFTRALCAEHAQANATVIAAIRTAAPERAWERAGNLWRVKLNNATTALYRGADAELRGYIAADRNMMDSWLEAHEAFLKLFYNDVSAAEMIALTVMNRMTELCAK